jgi:uncharacterized RDD family membrane protein YckC
MTNPTNPYAPPQAVVEDVVDPAAGRHLADRSTRLGATILDGLMFGLMVYLPVFSGFAFAGLAAGTAAQSRGAAAPSAPDISWVGPGIGLALGLVGFGVWLWFTIKYLRANGQSIGKRATRIKVVRRDGSPVSVSRVILLRNVLNGLLGMIPFYGLIDVLFIFGDARRCVHDHIADTIVIKA